MRRELIWGLGGFVLGVAVMLVLAPEDEQDSAAWPCVDCSTTQYPNQEAVDHIAAILAQASTDLASLASSDANYTQIRDDIAAALNFANMCLAGGQPPATEPAMTLAEHCQHLVNARNASMMALSATKWFDVGKELGHGH